MSFEALSAVRSVTNIYRNQKKRTIMFDGNRQDNENAVSYGKLPTQPYTLGTHPSIKNEDYFETLRGL